jgi:signal transduction histidine kinase
MINLPVYVVFMVFLGMLLMMELNRRGRIRLQKKISELENKLDVVKEELNELERLKSEMLARIGVSLRKPLESVRETAIELSRPLDRSPDVKEQLARLTTEIDEIENFLNVMKELAALENMDLTDNSQFPDGVESAMVTLDELLFETINEWNELFSSKGVSLAMSIDENVQVSGSVYYLRHALDNILSEISRIIVSGSLIHIMLSEEPDSVRLSIVHKGETRSKGKQSAFGVELARQIISAHRGWLTGDPDKGHYAIELPGLKNRKERQ